MLKKIVTYGLILVVGSLIPMLIINFCMDFGWFDSWGNGSDDGWLGYWGGFFGAITTLSVVFYRIVWIKEQQRKLIMHQQEHFIR